MIHNCTWYFHVNLYMYVHKPAVGRDIFGKYDNRCELLN